MIFKLPNTIRISLTAQPSGQQQRAHLIGAAGSGMRSLAELLNQAGWELTGSDSAGEPIANWPGHLMGTHKADHIRTRLNLIIHSDAVGRANVERIRADQLRLPTLNYPLAVAALMAHRRGLAVAGTHGKSTTAAMVAEILEHAGCSPTYLFGAQYRDGRPGGQLGRGDWMVAEACEYRANFRHLNPQISVLLGIEPDHFDYYRSWHQLETSFARYVGQMKPQAWLLFHNGCNRSRRIAATAPCRSESFGLEPDADWQAAISDIQYGLYHFTIRHRQVRLGRIALAVPGRHNVLNALAAAAAADHVGVSWSAIRLGLERFGGLSRRIEVIADRRRMTVIDDFAHLPTEVAAGLATVRELYPDRRLWCVFQPHQVSRTAGLLDEFAASLQNADKVMIADIFRAREAPAKPGDVTAADLAARTAARGANVISAHTHAEITAQLNRGLQAGDMLVTMGAGDIGKIAHAIAEWI